MGYRTQPRRDRLGPRASERRLAGLVATVTAVVLVASCAPGSGGGAAAGRTGAPATTPASGTPTHAGHGGTPPAAAPLRTGERFVNLSMPAPYQPSAPGGGTDEYRCFLVDPKLTGAAFLTGSQFVPQNGDIVHHAIFFRVGPNDVAAARKADADAPGEGWRCFGNAGIGDRGAWVAHWAPGSNETLLRTGIGYPMPAGSQLVMQVHYNLLGAAGRPAGTDQSSIRLRLTDGRQKLAALRTGLLAGPVELPCAPGETGPLCDRTAAVTDVVHRFGGQAQGMVQRLNQHCNDGRTPVAGSTQHCDYPVPAGGTIYAMAGHMHLLGRSIKVELNPGRPGGQTLLDVPLYNFDDQAIRPLAKPVTVKPGDTFRVTCTHDVTLRQRLPQLKTLPPRYVVWGEGTSDEMCLGLVIWSGPEN
jgi:hypothetical protein